MKYCRKCKKNFWDFSDYCDRCGSKLSKRRKVEKVYSKFLIGIKGFRMWAFVILIFLIVLFFLGNLIKVPYNGSLVYSEKVPVNKVDVYSVTEPFTTPVCNEANLSYNASWGKVERTCIEKRCYDKSRVCLSTNIYGICTKWEYVCTNEQCERYMLKCRLNIMNEDDEKGNFSFDTYSINKNNAKTFIKNLSFEILPKELRAIEWSFNFSSGNENICWYNNLIVSKKQVCYDVARQRTKLIEKNYTDERDLVVNKNITTYISLWQYFGWFR